MKLREKGVRYHYLFNIKISPFLKCLGFLLIALQTNGQGFLRVEGKYIVDENHKKIQLRGMGLGGWMVQEGYMLRFTKDGQQHVIKSKFSQLAGEEKTKEFYEKWLNNFIQKADIDSLKSWGFNSVRLPMHYNLFTLAVEDEPVKGKNTFLKKGFQLVDSLLKWCGANKMYVILDMHAAPGGQGNDVNISDRDPGKPSLWESPANQEKLIALWSELSRRYSAKRWIGGYDILNETNWGFQKPDDKNGLNEQENKPLKALSINIINAIRREDKNHIIIIEGNGWGNNYNGMLPMQDKNLVLSFHKYWNYNDQASIQKFLSLREKYNMPLWLGETGENSNVWFTEAVRLAETNNIGWSWWPMKKLGINNPFQVKSPDNYQQLLDYWNNSKPFQGNAATTLDGLAENILAQNCIFHKDVIDAMFRQVYSDKALPFGTNTIGNSIFAVDYDLGRNGIAYFDKDSCDYHISAGGDWVKWNTGSAYRNDGVDIETCNDSITNGYAAILDAGEWLQFTINVKERGFYNFNIRSSAAAAGQVYLTVNGEKIKNEENFLNSSSGQAWKTTELKDVKLDKGINRVKIFANDKTLLNFFKVTAVAKG